MDGFWGFVAASNNGFQDVVACRIHLCPIRDVYMQIRMIPSDLQDAYTCDFHQGCFITGPWQYREGISPNVLDLMGVSFRGRSNHQL